MFRRVVLESWHEQVPYICFALIAGVFVIVVLRALLMSKADVSHLASMPLRDAGDLSTTPESTPSETESQ
jgi:hypothetical protein